MKKALSKVRNWQCIDSDTLKRGDNNEDYLSNCVQKYLKLQAEFLLREKPALDLAEFLLRENPALDLKVKSKEKLDEIKEKLDRIAETTFKHNTAKLEEYRLIEKQVKTEYQINKIRKLQVNDDQNLFFDTRGNKDGVMKAFLDRTKELGIPVTIIYMQVTLETALERTATRADTAQVDSSKYGKLMSESEKDNYNSNMQHATTK